MRDNNFPAPVSDPEAEGLPGTADDDSSANDEVETGRWADGPSPAPLPADQPVAVNRYGTTAEEQRSGTPLDQRLAEEEPDFGADDPADPPRDENDEADEALDVEPAYDPHSKVSLYDRDDFDDVGGPVGRLVEPDLGYLPDEEKDLVAFDAGAAGGGPSAEEAAMHEVRPSADERF
jgi:hypothetical protein